MVEQADASEGHGHAILVACADDMVVANAAASLSYILHTALVGAFNVVSEGEECVRSKCNIGVLGNPLFLLFHRKYFGLFCKELLPYSIGQYIVVIFRDINVDGVVAVGTTNFLHPRKVHYLGVLT